MVGKRLLDKVIVVSGGTAGVGKAASFAFAMEGAKVIIGGRNKQAAQEVLYKILEHGGEAEFIPTQLTVVDDCRKLLDSAVSIFGKLDGFFSYAGVTSVSPLDTCSEKTFDDIIDVNFKAAFFCCQQAIKHMLGKGGSIVLTGSAHAWGGQKDRAAYACSKGVLYTLMEHIAHNYATDQIRCNYLTLGWTPTEGELQLRKSQGENEMQLRARAGNILPMGRMLENTDYLEALIYLMSDASKMMTGSNFRITAGEYI